MLCNAVYISNVCWNNSSLWHLVRIFLILFEILHFLFEYFLRSSYRLTMYVFLYTPTYTDISTLTQIFSELCFYMVNL